MSAPTLPPFLTICKFLVLSDTDNQPEVSVDKRPLTENEIQIHLDTCEGCKEHEQIHREYFQSPATGQWFRIPEGSDAARILLALH